MSIYYTIGHNIQAHIGNNSVRMWGQKLKYTSTKHIREASVSTWKQVQPDYLKNR